MADVTQPVTPAQSEPTGASLFVNDTTAVGKSGKAAIWSALSVIVIAALTAVVANPLLFTALHWGVLVVGANILLVFIKNIADKGTPNF